MANSNEKLVQNTLKTLGKEFVVVGKTRVRSWHAWLAIGLAIGISAGILYVANRSGEFEQGTAQTVSPTSYVLTISQTPRATVGLGRTLTNKRVDQSFTVPTNLPLQSVRLALTKVGTPTQQITASIRKTRTGPDLVSAVLASQSVGTTLSLSDAESTDLAQTSSLLNLVATFKSPITLTVGAKYFLVLTANTVNYYNFYRVAVDNLNPYSGGNIIASGLAKPRLDAVATMTFVKPTITVLVPNGKEIWQKGVSKTITWQPYNRPISYCGTSLPCPTPTPEPVTITLVQVSGLPCSSSPCPVPTVIPPLPIAKNIPDSGSFNWTVGQNLGGQSIPDGMYIIQISNSLSSDSSDGTFSITALISNKFKIGDLIGVTKGPINVRSCSSQNCLILGMQNAGALGTVSMPPPNPASQTYPAYVDGYWWWYVNFDSGADGWVVENYLEKLFIEI
ncbi:hypothetical protein A3H65_01825 [Candidatus Giovannonibacteria bacterium RIFCSPLOWO2_02_FULL_45_14]|uniref:SH3b domain-containing protein n=1 Tax=Candidatus Giovannonibacteria bacterium RIFCSPLOWO2_12_FULL_44_15 TaxID=1798364 RepID=A0A1F5XZS8_9BACT|nr:MAG: hypothetical protein A3C75_04030 [Candidatus Giovannonibacteria bacterium RIFCSPHIGHO2_02_FULL_44_31]OGF91190.1 MAG: hypothetical protein A3H65_01825 [Candidatus Giovannonibacteria bacterium RIFCSPLOWO2_02_FULL_45_14]OGF93359.1 MAG: hypothetical protein A3G54_00465 [Candidatus Giovannonibacteria bacterium RIFCSPLOWO2_12_FULL_44_15]